MIPPISRWWVQAIMVHAPFTKGIFHVYHKKIISHLIAFYATLFLIRGHNEQSKLQCEHAEQWARLNTGGTL